MSRLQNPLLYPTSLLNPRILDELRNRPDASLTSADLVRVLDGRASSEGDSRVVAPANVYRELRLLVKRGVVFSRRLDPDSGDAIPRDLLSAPQRVWLYSFSSPVAVYDRAFRDALLVAWPDARQLPGHNPAYPHLSAVKTPLPAETFERFISEVTVQAIHDGIDELLEELEDLRAFKARIIAATATSDA